MNRFQHSIASIAILAVSGLILVGITQSDAQAQTAPSATKVKVVNTPNVRVEKTLLSDGQPFALPPNPMPGLEIYVPADVVMTDLSLTLNAPSLATTMFVQAQSTGATLIYESVGSATSTWAANTSGRSTFHLQSGLTDPVGLRIGLTCNNIGGNSCSGAIMWSGYQP
jgi:hypothetical protein